MHLSMNTNFWGADGPPADYKPVIPTKALILSRFFLKLQIEFFTLSMMLVSMNTYFWVADGSPADYKPEIPTKSLILSRFF